MQKSALRMLCCGACVVSIIAFVALSSPPQGQNAWLSFDLCPQRPSQPGVIDWVSVALADGEQCPPEPLPAPSTMTVEREHFPTYGGVFGRGSYSFFVKVARPSFTSGELTFSIASARGHTLLAPTTESLLYLTDSAVACNASTDALCERVDETVVDAGVEAAQRRRLLTRERARPSALLEPGGRPPTARVLLKAGAGGGAGGTRGFAGGAGGRGWISSHATPQARWIHARTGPGGFPGAYHATPTRLTRAHVFSAGAVFLLLHHGNRGGFTAQHSREARTNVGVDDFLETSFDVEAADFPLRFELHSAVLRVGGSSAAAGAASADATAPTPTDAGQRRRALSADSAEGAVGAGSTSPVPLGAVRPLLGSNVVVPPPLLLFGFEQLP